eukprot:jgi/Psemu1/43136/gm1.43136_g
MSRIVAFAGRDTRKRPSAGLPRKELTGGTDEMTEQRCGGEGMNVEEQKEDVHRGEAENVPHRELSTQVPLELTDSGGAERPETDSLRDTRSYGWAAIV